MTKKALNYLLKDLDIYNEKELDTKERIDDDTHYLDQYQHTWEIITNELTENDVKISLMAKQTELLKSIKSMLSFFTVITVIGLCSAFIWIIFLLQ